MSSEQGKVPGSTHSQSGRPEAVLAAFLAHDPAARAAARSLRAGAEVAIRFTEVHGTWRAFRDGAGGIGLEARPATDADFELCIPPLALRELCTAGARDLGELGVCFFEHLVAKEPERRIQATVRSGALKLARRGWLALLAQGGTRVATWMGREGLRGPGAVAHALGRLRGK